MLHKVKIASLTQTGGIKVLLLDHFAVIDDEGLAFLRNNNVAHDLIGDLPESELWNVFGEGNGD